MVVVTILFVVVVVVVVVVILRLRTNILFYWYFASTPWPVIELYSLTWNADMFFSCAFLTIVCAIVCSDLFSKDDASCNR